MSSKQSPYSYQVKRAFLVILAWLKNEFRERFSLTEDFDMEGSIEAIRKDIYFRGHRVWILISSIFIASIGLNVNSTAVVIGAMLISPLMGPIVGMGYAIGTLDLSFLGKAAKNFGVMVGISLLTATLYFRISPISVEQTELVARTQPTILDVLIAFFGGLAGIVGSTRKEKGNVIAGVAIATALMPPLCTAGYGLALLKPKFFFGAFYLFLLNTVFIALATYLVVRILKFPQVQYANQAIEKRIRLITLSIALVIVLPSGWLFYKVIEDTIYENHINDYLKYITEEEKLEIINHKIVKTKGDQRELHLYLFGEPIDSTRTLYLEKQLAFFGVDKTRLVVHQEEGLTSSKAEILKKQVAGEIGSRLKQEFFNQYVEKKERQIASMQAIIDSLSKEKEQRLLHEKDVAVFVREVFAQYPFIQRISFAETHLYRADGEKFPITLLILYSTEIPSVEKQIQMEEQLKRWVKARFGYENVEVIWR